MATSGSYDFSSSRNTIISGAFRKMGRLGDYEAITDSVNSGKLAAGIAALNPMIKAFQALGMPLWAITEQYIALSNWSSSASATIGPSMTINQVIKPLKVLQAYRRDNIVSTDPRDEPVNIYTYDDYQNLSQKEEQGTPTHLFYQPLAYTGKLTLWPRPDTYWQTNGQLYIRYHRPFQDFDSSTDEPDFPVEWHEALIFNLADRLSFEYGLSERKAKEIKEKAAATLVIAESFGTEEGSLRIIPTINGFL